MKIRERKRREPNLQHGLSYTPEYRAWQLIRLRCTDPKHAAYPNYGGRGITMYAPWVSDPAAFVAHVGERPTPKHEIDRIDNDRGYEPGNLRWATRKEQANNRRSNVNLTFRGETLSLSAWCDRLGLKYGAIGKRIQAGRTVEEALETPVRPKRPNGTVPKKPPRPKYVGPCRENRAHGPATRGQRCEACAEKNCAAEAKRRLAKEAA